MLEGFQLRLQRSHRLHQRWTRRNAVTQTPVLRPHLEQLLLQLAGQFGLLVQFLVAEAQLVQFEFEGSMQLLQLQR